jgi:polysaccharide biosynthesis/export protein
MVALIWKRTTMSIQFMRLPSALTWILLVLIAGGLSACSNGGGLGGGASAIQSTDFAPVGTGGAKPIQGQAAVNAQKIFASNTGGDASNDDYKIAALDVIEVTVLGVPELSRTLQVSSSGNITLPLIKNVKAGGRTQAELEREIAGKLGTTYLQSPQVSVFVKEYNSQRITVDGAVNKPGIFPTSGKVSLLQAIALAEGLNLVADTSGILVFRTVDNKRMGARFDLKQIRGGKISDPILQAGDIVMVDESSSRTTLRDIKDAMPLSGLFNLLLL